jgi:hypothetical protein
MRSPGDGWLNRLSGLDSRFDLTCRACPSRREGRRRGLPSSRGQATQPFAVVRTSRYRERSARAGVRDPRVETRAGDFRPLEGTCNLNPIFACTTCADDWRQFLARPELQWKERYPAHAVATSWQGATGFPAEVAKVVATSTELADARPLIGVPEYRVPLPGGRRASQSDVLVLGRASGGAFAMVVEGKVAESFGPIVRDWLAVETPGRLLRWSFLCNLLNC